MVMMRPTHNHVKKKRVLLKVRVTELIMLISAANPPGKKFDNVIFRTFSGPSHMTIFGLDFRTKYGQFMSRHLLIILKNVLNITYPHVNNLGLE